MFIALVLLAQAAAAANVPLFRGVNIHFTQQQPGELAMLAKGFQGVRMDFSWAAVEPQAGQYDFSAYDRLVSDLSQAQLFPYFILDYANPLYDGGAPPQSDGAIAAFVAFARAALGRYAGQGIVWEMWNEPNGDNFWPPKHNATAYARLALAVGTMFKSAFPNEVLVGPTTSGFDWDFITTTFQAGVLRYFDGVSVHPYRVAHPETAVRDFATLRALVQQYAPEGRGDLPLVSGEWGYTTCELPCHEFGPFTTDAQQADFLARQWLLEAAIGVPVSIWYDWHDDGADPREREQNFGTVTNTYNNATLPYTPKPSYAAAVTARSLTFGLSQRPEALSASLLTPDAAATSDAAATPGTATSCGLLGGNSSDPLCYALLFQTGGSVRGAPRQTIAVWRMGLCGEVPVTRRFDCGFEGITADECGQRGCCFDDSTGGAAPACFFHNSNATGTVRVPCPSGATAASCFSAFGVTGAPAQPPTLCCNATGAEAPAVDVLVRDSPVYLSRSS